MEDSRFSAATSLLEAAGVTVDRDEGFRHMGPKGKLVSVDVTGILADGGVTPQEYMEEWLERDRKALADEMNRDETLYEEERESDIRTRYTHSDLVHERIKRMSDWAAPDDRWFSRFRFAHNPIDNTFVLVISMTPGKIAAIPMSGNPQALVSAIAAKCSKADPMTPGKYRNLYQELTAGFTETLQGVVDRWRNREFMTPEDFIKHAGMHLPHSMLKNLSWDFITLKVCKKIGSQEHKFYVPTVMKLEGPSCTQYTPIEFLVYSMNLLVSRPEMLCPMPKVYTNNPDEPALCYLDLDSICREGPCPTWDKYIRRYRHDHAEAFMAFIYSIFDAENTSRQALNIVDNGFTGKSFVMNCIIETLGSELCTSLQKDSMANQFSLAKVWDKRLVTYGDNKNKNLLMSEKLHMMTGHDYAEIEMKGRNSFHAKLQCKVIISGNTALEIHPDAVHETSRLIQITTNMTDDILKEFCALDKDGNVRRRPNGSPVYIGDPSFGKRLKEEFPCFLTKCREVYGRLCPNRSEIIISDEMFEEMMALAPVETYTLADFYERNFEYCETSVIPVRDFGLLYQSRLEDYMDSSRNKPPFDMKEFKEYVDKRTERKVKFGVTRRLDGKPTKVHVGLRFRPRDNTVDISRYEWGGQ